MLGLNDACGLIVVEGHKQNGQNLSKLVQKKESKKYAMFLALECTTI